METLIETIRNAIAEGANDEVRATGATACRTILAALEARAGEPLAVPPASIERTPTLEPEKVAAFIGALRNAPIDQLLDLAIQRLRVALPKDIAPVAPVVPLKFRILPIAPLATRPTDRSGS